MIALAAIRGGLAAVLGFLVAHEIGSSNVAAMVIGGLFSLLLTIVVEELRPR
jgi:hypothetical protein